MNKQAKEFIDRFLLEHDATTRETIATLGAEEPFVLVDLFNDSIDVRGAILNKYRDSLVNSVMALTLAPLQNAIYGMQFDFLLGRYAEVGRTLRFAWELVFRAYFVDNYTSLFPDSTDFPGHSLGSKLQWLEQKRLRLTWETVFRPVFNYLFENGKQDGVTEYFKPNWDRLIQVSHPSMAWFVSGTEESSRLAFNHFDETLARQIIGDAREVLGVIWFAMLRQFPDAMNELFGKDNVFYQTPQIRAIIGCFVLGGTKDG